MGRTRRRAGALMEDWRKTGQRLRDEIERAYARMSEEILKLWPRAEAEKMLQAMATKSYTSVNELHCDHLIQRLQSDAALSRPERMDCADFLQRALDARVFRLKRKEGRPIDSELREAAALALHFYREWRQRNQAAGIADHGKGDRMKDEAIAFALAKRGLSESSYDSVREIMDHPGRRLWKRKPA